MSATTGQSPDREINHRLISQTDEQAVIDLMLQSGFPISGIVSKSIYQSLIRDALNRTEVKIAVAVVDKEIAAFLLTITDYSRYWKNFMLRHPLLGIKIVYKRLKKKSPRREIWPELTDDDRAYVNSITTGCPPGRSWSDSGPLIAKGVFVQVDPRFRGLKLSISLYFYLMDFLASAGVTRIDAKVDLNNLRAMPLHSAIGYQLERRGNTLFATKDLSTRE